MEWSQFLRIPCLYGENSLCWAKRNQKRKVLFANSVGKLRIVAPKGYYSALQSQEVKLNIQLL